MKPVFIAKFLSSHTTENIPYSLGHRIGRICSITEDREKRFLELIDLLLSRDYKPKLIDATINKARDVPRREALKRVVKDKSPVRPVFVINYDPRHWRTMVQDHRLAEIFPLPPLVAYKMPQNIKDKLIGAKVPPMPTSRPIRDVHGMKRCLKCAICPFVREGKTVNSTANNCTIEINSSVDCSSRNISYMLGSKKCPNKYIGESERSVKERYLEHKGYVTNKICTKATGLHFNEKGHSVIDMEITILEKVFNCNPQFRKQREKMWINKFRTRYKVLNQNTGGWKLLIASQKMSCFVLLFIFLLVP